MQKGLLLKQSFFIKTERYPVSNKRLVLTRRGCESEALSHSC